MPVGRTPSRRRNSPAARLRAFWIVFVVALIGVGIGLYYAAGWSGFRPKHVRVVGNSVVSTNEILERAAIDRKRNIWLQNTGAMAQRVDAIPYVLRTQIHRGVPATVTIVVTERRPFAIVRSGEDEVLVDRLLRVLQPADGAPTLPVFVLDPGADLTPGRTIASSSAVVLRDAEFGLVGDGAAPAQLRDSDGEVIATMPNGVRVLLGDESNVAAAMHLVAPILSKLAKMGRQVETLDLRAPGTPVITASRRGRDRNP